MACPHCGGTERRAISPGFWECTSLLYGSVPTGLHPSGRFGPAFQTVANPCGRRYQEGAPGGTGMLCQTCTVFAIGICADCGIPQCGNGDCGRHYRGAFLCARCRQARVAAEGAAAHAAKLKAVDEAARQRAAAAQRADATKTWLRAVARILDAGVRRTHLEGWAIGPATERSIQTTTDSYRGYGISTAWQESQLIVTSTGELQTYLRSKPRKTSWRWSKAWTVPATHDNRDLSAVAAYVHANYGVSVPKFDA
jgi:hypothetical protein